jgi:hypothetical protein
VRLTRLLPTTAFRWQWINARKSACSSYPVRSRLLVAAFRSLVTTVRSPDHHSEVNVPGLLLRRLAVPPSGPLIFCSPTRRGFEPTTGGFIAQTRCLMTVQPSRLLFRSLLPREAFAPSWDQRIQSDSVPGKPAFRTRPISLRSPQSCLVKVTISDQRSRSATFP